MTTLRSGLRACWVYCAGAVSQRLRARPRGKSHPLALDVGAGGAEQFERPRHVAELDADLLQHRFGVALDDREALFAQHFRERNRAGDIGDRGHAALRAGRAPRFAATARFMGGGAVSMDMAAPFGRLPGRALSERLGCGCCAKPPQI